MCLWRARKNECRTFCCKFNEYSPDCIGGGALDPRTCQRVVWTDPAEPPQDASRPDFFCIFGNQERLKLYFGLVLGVNFSAQCTGLKVGQFSHAFVQVRVVSCTPLLHRRVALETPDLPYIKPYFQVTNLK